MSKIIKSVEEVGPRGQFLTQKSTRRNLRKMWVPGITHQWSPEKPDFRDPQEVAGEKIKWILGNHRPKPLDQKGRK